MFRIGEFARLGGVSVRALHHYDEVGVLSPAEVDTSTGYRLYAARQLGPLNRIVALKELGFSLSQVGQILTGIDELQICTAYHGAGRFGGFPMTHELGSVEPGYESHPGWDTQIGHIRTYRELPAAAQDYVDRIEEVIECRIDSPLDRHGLCRPVDDSR